MHSGVATLGHFVEGGRSREGGTLLHATAQTRGLLQREKTACASNTLSYPRTRVSFAVGDSRVRMNDVALGGFTPSPCAMRREMPLRRHGASFKNTPDQVRCREGHIHA